MLDKIARPIIMTLGLLTIGLPATAQEDPADQIKYRQNTMSANGGHIGAIALILRQKVDHPGHLALHTQGLRAISETLPDLFPEGSDMGDTEALPAIWENPEDFQATIEQSQEAVAAFAAAVEADDQEAILPAFKKVGDSCKACHDDFRKEE